MFYSAAPVPCDHTTITGDEADPFAIQVSSNSADESNLFNEPGDSPWEATVTDDTLIIRLEVTAPGDVTIVGFDIGVKHVAKLHATVFNNGEPVADFKVK